MSSNLPAITGYQLIAYLEKGGWATGRKANHGRTMTKSDGTRTRVTFIPETRASLPKGTLSAILGSYDSKGLKNPVPLALPQYSPTYTPIFLQKFTLPQHFFKIIYISSIIPSHFMFIL